MKMRTLPILLSLAESMKRLAMQTTPLYADPSFMYRLPDGHIDRQLQRYNWDDDDLNAPKIGKRGFQVSIDVAEFKPNELNVKMVDNNVVIEGKHEDRKDSVSFVSRQFERRYELPPGYDPSSVTSTLSSDGVLTVTVPKPHLEKGKVNERVVPIQQTGPAYINIKKNPSDD